MFGRLSFGCRFLVAILCGAGPAGAHAADSGEPTPSPLAAQAKAVKDVLEGLGVKMGPDYSSVPFAAGTRHYLAWRSASHDEPKPKGARVEKRLVNFAIYPTEASVKLLAEGYAARSSAASLNVSDIRVDIGSLGEAFARELDYGGSEGDLYCGNVHVHVTWANFWDWDTPQAEIDKWITEAADKVFLRKMRAFLAELAQALAGRGMNRPSTGLASGQQDRGSAVQDASRYQLVIEHFPGRGQPAARLAADQHFRLPLDGIEETRAVFRVQVLDAQGRPVENVRCRIRLAGPLAPFAQVDRDGERSAAAEQTFAASNDPVMAKWLFPGLADPAFRRALERDDAEAGDMSIDVEVRFTPLPAAPPPS